jgi:hypothetical protein
MSAMDSCDRTNSELLVERRSARLLGRNQALLLSFPQRRLSQLDQIDPSLLPHVTARLQLRGTLCGVHFLSTGSMQNLQVCIRSRSRERCTAINSSFGCAAPWVRQSCRCCELTVGAAPGGVATFAGAEGTVTGMTQHHATLSVTLRSSWAALQW